MASRVKSARAASRDGARPSSAPDVEMFDDFRDLEGALKIDEYGLDEALSTQPEAFYRVAKSLAMEISRRDAAKQALQDAEADAELRVRDQAEDDKKKMVADEVRARVQTDAGVRAARDRLFQLAESVGKLSSLKEAFQQRSYALKDLVGLYIANYYTASENTGAAASLRDRDASEARRRMADERRRGN